MHQLVISELTEVFLLFLSGVLALLIRYFHNFYPVFSLFFEGFIRDSGPNSNRNLQT